MQILYHYIWKNFSSWNYSKNKLLTCYIMAKININRFIESSLRNLGLLWTFESSCGQWIWFGNIYFTKFPNLILIRKCRLNLVNYLFTIVRTVCSRSLGQFYIKIYYYIRWPPGKKMIRFKEKGKGKKEKIASKSW